ncbi:MAG: ATP-dependent helicase [Kyrpidia sp.]|nr:ATP-dependent helicase [Kyrpidia sp.]
MNPRYSWQRRMTADGWRLTEEQWAAVLSPAERIAVYAGPGTGKTTVLAARVLYLIQVCHIPPAGLLVTTFTREAAVELRERLRPWISGRALLDMEVGTLHSRLLRWWIRERGRAPRILTPAEQTRVVDGAARSCGMTAEQAWAALALDKSRRPGYSGEPDGNRLRHAYQQELKRRGVWDFDDILLNAYDLLFLEGKRSPWRAVLVDEAQDLNEIQSALVEGLCRKASLFLIGDDDQSIYGFRGAEPKYFQSHLVDRKTSVFHLSINHRSHQGLVIPCNRLIAHNRDSQRKAIRSRRTGPWPEVRDFGDEWEQYRWLGEEWIREKVQGATLAVLARTHQELQEAFHAVGRWMPAKSDPFPTLHWHTFHGVKGKEFDRVYILNAVEGRAPHLLRSHPSRENRKGGKEDVEEERRLFYVAMTRARERLVICVPHQLRGRRVRVSRFIGEAGLRDRPAVSWWSWMKRVLRGN